MKSGSFHISKNSLPSIQQEGSLRQYTTNQQIHFNIYDVFYSQCSHQHVTVGIPAIFSVMLLLQECKCTDLVNSVTVTP